MVDGQKNIKLVAEYLPRRTGFNTWSFLLVNVVDNVALGGVYLQVSLTSTASIIPPMLRVNRDKENGLKN
jgi:hypothetical protein